MTDQQSSAILDLRYFSFKKKKKTLNCWGLLLLLLSLFFCLLLFGLTGSSLQCVQAFVAVTFCGLSLVEADRFSCPVACGILVP